MKNRIHPKFAGSILIAAALACAGSSAYADTPTISADATGSLTIHDFQQPVEYLPDTEGMPLPTDKTVGLIPVVGAEFSVQQVPAVDLSTNAGWLQAEAIVEAFDPFTPDVVVEGASTPMLQKKTDADGVAPFVDLPVGLYLVKQVGIPPVEGNQQVTPAMPFLVTVPLTEPGSLDRWVYDVHVYPKNVFTQVDKTVNDQDVSAAGEVITYKIGSSIPGGSVTDKYIVKDKMDPKLEFQEATVTIAGAATSDFTVEHVSGTVTITLGDQARTMAFEALKQDDAAKIVTTITAKVKEAGEIDNRADVTFSREGEVETNIPSTSATTKFGGIQVSKVNALGAPLKGAEFEVRAAHTNNFKDAEKVAVNGKSTWVSNDQGSVMIGGLRYSGFANGEAAEESSGKYNFYWLVETKAPAGYELLGAPVPFTVDKQVGDAGVVTVKNVPHNAGGFLPKTGAQGTLAAAVAGLALAGLGASLLMRRSAQQTKA